MVRTYRDKNIDKRDHPPMQNEVPMPAQQKEALIERLKEQREALEKINADMR